MWAKLKIQDFVITHIFKEMKAKSDAENRSGFQPNMLPLAACQLSFS